jgi:hypothetical protein
MLFCLIHNGRGTLGAVLLALMGVLAGCSGSFGSWDDDSDVVPQLKAAFFIARDTQTVQPALWRMNNDNHFDREWGSARGIEQPVDLNRFEDELWVLGTAPYIWRIELANSETVTRYETGLNNHSGLCVGERHVLVMGAQGATPTCVFLRRKAPAERHALTQATTEGYSMAVYRQGKFLVAGTLFGAVLNDEAAAEILRFQLPGTELFGGGPLTIATPPGPFLPIVFFPIEFGPYTTATIDLNSPPTAVNASTSTYTWVVHSPFMRYNYETEFLGGLGRTTTNTWQYIPGQFSMDTPVQMPTDTFFDTPGLDYQLSELYFRKPNSLFMRHNLRTGRRDTLLASVAGLTNAAFWHD